MRGMSIDWLDLSSYTQCTQPLSNSGLLAWYRRSIVHGNTLSLARGYNVAL